MTMPRSHSDADPKRHPFEIGELVQIVMHGSIHFSEKGIVVDRIHYTDPGKIESAHLDEYSCCVLLQDHPGTSVMVRAKWLVSLSKVKSA